MASPHYSRPAMSLIEEGLGPNGVSLFIGGADAVADLQMLERNGVTTVVNCAVNLDFDLVRDDARSATENLLRHGHGEFRYYKIGMIDGPGNPDTLLLAGYYILHSALIQEMPNRPSYPHHKQGNVLVNCRAGRSRSVALTALFLHRTMPQKFPTLEKAIQHVRIRRELRAEEWHETPKPVLVSALHRVAEWISLVGDEGVRSVPECPVSAEV